MNFDNGEEWVGQMSNGSLHGAGKLRRPRRIVHVEHGNIHADEYTELDTTAATSSTLLVSDESDRSLTKKKIGEECTARNKPPGSRVWIQDGSSNKEEDVIMKNDLVVCKKNDLVQGRQVVHFTNIYMII